MRAGTEIAERRRDRCDRTRGVLQPVATNQQPERAASNQRRGYRVFPSGGVQTIKETSLLTTHRTIPFTVSLSFSSWRNVSRGVRWRASSRLIPTANRMPARAAATIAEIR